ncbi:MAG: DUF3015 domain-containing protein [Gammaproteobacteria bacterium]|jgi:hypothetical protein
MKKLSFAAMMGVLLVAPATQAQEQTQQQGETANSTGCGVGTMLFQGQRGVVPQVVAVTTNGTFGNQTFGISSGTLGCTQDGVIKPPAEVRMLLLSNLDNLARDVARGEGETIESLAHLMAIEESDKKHFFTTLQANFGRIFPNANVTADEVFISMRAVMTEDTLLNRYVA